MSRRGRGLLAALVLLAPLAGCGAADGTTTLRVYAAASLASAFERVADDLEAEHDGLRVQVVAGGSSDLVTQITEGAPADVLATADTATMDRLVEAGLADGEPRPFATNTLQIAVPAGNPGRVTGLPDLARAGLRVVVCAPQVPCGAAAGRLADAAGVRLAPDSEEQSVTDVLGKVTSGEADAGLVYRTDVEAAGDAVEGVEVPGASSAANVYPVVRVAGGEQASLAGEFLALVTGEAGRRVLAEAGFGPAPGR